MLLTKPSVGVGPVWFAARGEWRKLALALGIAAVSFVIAPGLWTELAKMLISRVGNVPAASLVPVAAPLRMVAEAGIVVGARRGWPRIVPVATVIAMPIVWFSSLSILVAALPLWRQRRSPRATLECNAALLAVPDSGSS